MDLHAACACLHSGFKVSQNTTGALCTQFSGGVSLITLLQSGATWPSSFWGLADCAAPFLVPSVQTRANRKIKGTRSP